jgi:hypothetical protein
MNGKLTPDAISLELPTVHPHCGTLDCPKCGAVLAAQPLRLRLLRLLGIRAAFMHVNYCPGGRKLEGEDAILQTPIPIKTRITMPCAGIEGEHLHVNCCFCSYQLLMRTRDQL